MTDAPQDPQGRGRTLSQPVVGNPFDPRHRHASFAKPSELIDIVEITPLSLHDRRVFNLLLAHAWDSITEDKVHRVPKIIFKGSHTSYDRLVASIRSLMGAQVEVLVTIGGKKHIQSIHLLSTIARPHDEASDGFIYYRFPSEFRKVVQNSSIFARLTAEVMFCFRSKYALALWEIISKRVNLRHVKSEEFEIDRIRQLLGVEPEQYKLHADLERFVLKPALKEVNLFGGYHVQMERRRMGKRVGWIILSWQQKDHQDLKATYALVGGHSAARAAALQGTEIIVVDSPEARAVQRAEDDPFAPLDELPL
jgi:Initiator Replication protein